MTAILLDASALLAMLYDEPGGARVAAMLPDARMCVVNLAEVMSHYIHRGMSPEELDAMLDPLSLTLVPVDAALARAAGHLRALTAQTGLSLDDRFCLALAMQDGLPVWTADRQWLSIAEKVGVDVVMIR